MAFCVLGAGGCEVEWGGAKLALEDPSPREMAPAPTGDTARRAPSLPEGPLLYAVRGGDTARVVPVARIVAGLPAPLGIPAGADAAYRARFDSAFLRPGAELLLLAGHARVGSLVLEGASPPPGDGCLTAATALPLLTPDGRLPPVAFAVPPGTPAPPPSAWAPGVAGERVAAYAPILAERLLREAGVNQPWLARPVALAALPPAQGEAMTATYLLGDTLAPVPPAEEGGASLFFLARPEPVDFQPRWTIARRYDAPEEKEIYVWLDRVPLPGGAVDILLRYDAASVRLAASPVEEERRITWVEEAGCSGLRPPAETNPR